MTKAVRMNVAEAILETGNNDAIERLCFVCAISTNDIMLDAIEGARIWNFDDRSAIMQTSTDFEAVSADFVDAIEHNPSGLTLLEALQRAESLGYNKVLNAETGDYSLADAIRYAAEDELKGLTDGNDYTLSRTGLLKSGKNTGVEFEYDILLAVQEAGFDLKAIDKALQARRASVKSEAKSNSARLNGLKGGRPKKS